MRPSGGGSIQIVKVLKPHCNNALLQLESPALQTSTKVLLGKCAEMLKHSHITTNHDVFSKMLPHFLKCYANDCILNRYLCIRMHFSTHFLVF